MLQSFARGERTYEDALAPIWRLLAVENKPPTAPSECVDNDLLREKVLRRQTWAAVADQFQLAGKAEVLLRLRAAVAQRLG